MEIDHEVISTAILILSADSEMVIFSYKRKYVHEVLVSCLVKLAQVKSVVRWTDHPAMTIAVDWDIKHQTKQNWSGSPLFAYRIFYKNLKENVTTQQLPKIGYRLVTNKNRKVHCPS